MIRLLLLLVMLSWQGHAAARSVADLIAAGELEIASWISPDDSIVVGQELELTIEIATQRWFAGGTRITLPEADGLVVLRRDQFANNLNRTTAGVGWVVQRWTIQLYPQREGVFNIPALALELAVNDSSGIVRGVASSPPLSFSATMPAGVDVDKAWVAAPQFSAQLQTDRDLVELVPGDAFSVDIVLQASDLAAMMLPTLELPEFEGLAAYPEPPVLTNRSNRGTATALREQRVTYVVEQPGQYYIAEQQLQWWDTSNASLQIVSLPALSIDAGTAVARVSNDNSATTTAAPTWHQLTQVVLALLALAASAWVGSRLWSYYKQSNDTLWRRGNRALRRGDAASASHWFYAWLNGSRPQPGWLSLRASVAPESDVEPAASPVEKLLSSAYGNREAALPRRLAPRSNERGSNIGWRRWLPGPVQLRLNPDSSSPPQPR